jgi:hypothetical protein
MPEPGEASLTEQRVAWLEKNIRQLLMVAGRPGVCRACGRDIFWLEMTKSGKFAPYTKEGVNHFADCEHADEFRKSAKATGP